MDDVDHETQALLEQLGAQLVTKKSTIRQLKKDGSAPEVVSSAVKEMKELQAKVDALRAKVAGPEFDRAGMEDVMVRRMIVVPSFEIHGGTSGFFDFGPVGCALKDNILQVWKRHFVYQERMLQVEATCLTMSAVLETSGHVERFVDLMCKDPETGFCYRADKLLEDHLENLIETSPEMPKEEKEDLWRIHRQADAFSPEELGDLINNRFKITAPDTGNVLTAPFPFNLMFKTQIGPQGNAFGFLRPETAQGIFVNFKRLLDFNNGRVPFAAAQIGLGFRNEISPRAGLIRVREFQMAEIEHFVHPEFKDHPKFATVQDIVLNLFSSKNQMETGKILKISVGEAVSTGIIANETLAYFMARTHLFLEKIGVDMKRVRFRQHLPTEMAHYACECWDAEIHVSYGWVECVGHADRACYDLKVHAEATKANLMATRALDPPKMVEYAKIKADKKTMGKVFKRESAVILAHLEEIPVDETMKIFETLTAGEPVDVVVDGKTFQLQPGMIQQVTRTTKRIQEEKFYPSVIEPSFGIGRIMYALLEHSFYLRGDDGEESSKKKEKGVVDRTVFRFNAFVAPVKCGICPLLKKPELEEIAFSITDKLIDNNLYSQCDNTSAAIGRKYSRLDEIGVPFCSTVDAESLENGSVTLRERDSQQQVRLPSAEVLVRTVHDLCAGNTTWEDVVKSFGLIN
uniref:glycine--tRNA ligase n=1 Tax=Mucochytrium quahogii TaxID=96639 RepID=A0A7S2WQ73_9STRA|mmetsp:Transcript_6467/g.14273  ORF Transcript_6467/g.14273 Transcript_6467/m.14273 type:complete len:688 (+) Transcript_6467:89-2152(+)|eukprot:CAMPEP_0203757590 /NCGR_PEP_ID=MMETSP0098-20131031/10583_1 /ASSEMBLY_ACC=CAM_ASM_000208 /TAXON_ID=96639 /ORGANISM=" , Strain NY0313808BC1" /LENGTH=687 /DNA_ID=CAMNT_0050649815 /DNA_START=8 /DNA_END=2071 /DNA_ORIENTATION=+